MIKPVIPFCCAIVLCPLALAQPANSGPPGYAGLLSGDLTAQGQPAPNGVLKLFQIISPGSLQPLTPKQRFIGYLMATVGPVPIFVEGAVAAYDQGFDHPREWRLGAAGYGERFANDFAYNGVRQTLAYGVSSLLGEDTRYYPSDSRNVWPRTRHALLSTFKARRHGREVFSISTVTAAAGASLISRAWVPPSWQHGKNVGASFAWTMAGIAGFNVAREFLPDLWRK